MQRLRYVVFLVPFVLSSCFSFSSSNPPPPNRTTVVVPDHGAAACDPSPC